MTRASDNGKVSMTQLAPNNYRGACADCGAITYVKTPDIRAAVAHANRHVCTVLLSSVTR